MFKLGFEKYLMEQIKVEMEYYHNNKNSIIDSLCNEALNAQGKAQAYISVLYMNGFISETEMYDLLEVPEDQRNYG